MTKINDDDVKINGADVKATDIDDNNIDDTKLPFSHCEYVLVKASDIQKYISKEKLGNEIVIKFFYAITFTVSSSRSKYET